MKTIFQIWLEKQSTSLLAMQLKTTKQVIQGWKKGSIPNPDMIRTIIDLDIGISYPDFYEYGKKDDLLE